VDHVFEIEGNSVDESQPPEDWDTINPVDGVTRTGPAGAAQNATFVADITNDRYFTGGSSKDFIDIEGNWQITDTSVPDKDEIGHAYAATYVDNTGVTCTSPGVPDGCNPVKGHKVLVFGGDRLATNGDANIGFWFFQGEVSVDLDNNVFHGSHQNGDLFIVSAFTGGGGTSTIDVYEWVGTPNPDNLTETNFDRCQALGGVLDLSGDDTICKVTSAGKASAVVNNQQIFLDWPYTPKGGDVCNNDPANCPAAAGAFYEGGIDLTALGLGEECFASFMLETRSSQSVDAVLKDFALGQFESCSATCDKSVDMGEVCEDPANPGFSIPVTYTFSTTNTGGTTLGQTFKDDNGTPGNTADDVYVTGGVTTGPAPFGTCTTSLNSADALVITVNPGETKGCQLTRALPVGSSSQDITDTLTVHTVSPVGALADCTETAVVTVNPLPDATPQELTLCESTFGGGTASFNLTAVEGDIIGSQTGVTLTWFSDSALTTAIDTPGAYVSGDGFAYAKVTVDDTGCFSSAAVTLNVNPQPTVNQPGNQEVCNGDSTSAITFTGTALATFNWTNDNTSIGLAASGTGSIAAFTATNSGTTDQVATITVTPTSVDGCVGPSKNFTITVKPTPTVNDPPDQTLCNGALTDLVHFTGAVAGTTFNWTNDTPSIGLAAAGSGDIAAFAAVNNGASNVVATITVTPVADGCEGEPQTFTITVKPTPTVEICPDETEADSCTLDNDLLLRATVLPVGGTITYSWNKVGNATVLGTGPTLLVDAPGTYRVVITRDGCSAEDTIHVGLCAECIVPE
jgi:hypothetical protein